MTPTARSVKLLRDRGFQVTNVQKFVAPIKRFMDAYGFGDLLICNEERIALVQVTTLAHMNEREAKIRTKCKKAFEMWCHKGEVWIHGWRPPSTARGKRFKGKASQEWTVSEKRIVP